VCLFVVFMMPKMFIIFLNSTPREGKTGAEVLFRLDPRSSRLAAAPQSWILRQACGGARSLSVTTEGHTQCAWEVNWTALYVACNPT
jgi:hypothetical protein